MKLIAAIALLALVGCDKSSKAKVPGIERLYGTAFQLSLDGEEGRLTLDDEPEDFDVLRGRFSWWGGSERGTWTYNQGRLEFRSASASLSAAVRRGEQLTGRGTFELVEPAGVATGALTLKEAQVIHPTTEGPKPIRGMLLGFRDGAQVLTVTIR